MYSLQGLEHGLTRLLKRLLRRIISIMTHRRCIDFASALQLVFPGCDIPPGDFAAIQKRWNDKASERWAVRKKEPVTFENGLSYALPVPEAVCVVVDITRDWRYEEQQVALRQLEKRLAELRAFDEPEAGA